MNWLFTNERIRPRATQHVQDQYFEFVEHLGIDPWPAEWRRHEGRLLSDHAPVEVEVE